MYASFINDYIQGCLKLDSKEHPPCLLRRISVPSSASCQLPQKRHLPTLAPYGVAQHRVMCSQLFSQLCRLQIMQKSLWIFVGYFCLFVWWQWWCGVFLGGEVFSIHIFVCDSQHVLVKQQILAAMLQVGFIEEFQTQ